MSSEESEGDDDEETAKKKKKTKEEEIREKKIQLFQQTEAAIKAQNVIFNDNEIFNLKNVKNISFDQGPIALITLQFGV